MKMPPFLAGAALLFWGWFTGFLPFAAMMAVALESSRFIKTRWDFSEKDLFRSWDLCALLFFGGMALFYAADEARNAFAFVQWLPFFFFPIALAQAFAVQPSMDIRTFSWFLRRKPASPETKRFNVGYPYFGICVMSTGATNSEGLSFYFGLTLLLGCALWDARSKRFSKPLTLGLLLAIAAAGLVTHRGMRELQTALETAIGNWFNQRLQRRVNSRESRTSLGQIGRLKLSGRIVLRVEPERRHSPPGLLREATYKYFNRDVWFSEWHGSTESFGVVPGDANFVWRLLPTHPKTNHVIISRHLTGGEGILALPNGVAEIRDLPAAQLLTNRLGVVRVKDGPGFARLQASFGPGETMDRAPSEEDLMVPDREKPAITAIARSLGFSEDTKTDDEKLKIIARFFASQFQYSTYLPAPKSRSIDRRTPLSRFLLETRSGHCEYFATATVLLLRQAGLPARYATGYSVQEATDHGRQFVVRERHAHAWTLVYRNHAWEEFDTTPASWEPIERQQASVFEPLSDFWSRLWFEFSKWRYGKGNYRQYLVWALIPLVGILAWRILFRKDRRRVSSGELRAALPVPRPGEDSEFYQIERELSRHGWSRASSEPITNWLRRVPTEVVPFTAELNDIVELHYRYRFDPLGLSTEDRGRLRVAAESWIEEARQKRAA